MAMKFAKILDGNLGGFGLEYDNTLGKKNTMRLDALTYEAAISEARSFLGIDANDHDPEGVVWHVE